MNRKLTNYETDSIHSLIQPASLEPIFLSIAVAGGVVFLVGGAVRDLLLDLSIKDLDFEVHSLSLDKLRAILSQFGEVNSVGKSFGVLKTRARSDSPEIDWSLPRMDSTGRKPDVTIDPTMTIEKALARRDLTINAMALNMMTYELHDPFGGEQDVKNATLRCADENTFSEDPLRFFRVMQFMGRFGFAPDAQLNRICKTMDISIISRERIEEELRKLLLKSEEPSRGFRWLHEIGRLQEIFPEIAVLIEVPQTLVHHPEGSVFEHTMQVLDAAASIRNKLESEGDQLALMYAALCHDLGKAKTTVFHEDGRISSHGHEDEGSRIAKQLLKRYCGNKELIEKVQKLVYFHMIPGQLIQSTAKTAAYKRLALKLAPETNAQMLALLFEADRRGRNGEEPKPLLGPVEEAQTFLGKMNEARVGIKPEEPVLQGRDLLDIVEPGPRLGELVRKAYEIQIEEGIQDKETLKKRVLES